MSTISVACSNCEATLKAPIAMAGKAAKCPKCSGQIQIPAAQPAARPTPQAAPAAGRPPRRPTPNPAPAPAAATTTEADPFANLAADDPNAPSPATSRARSRGRSGISPKVLAVALGIFALSILLLGGAGYLAYAFASGGASHMRYMPDDLAVMGVVRYSEIRNSKFFKTAESELPQAKGADAMVGQQIGFMTKDPDKVDTIWVGGNSDEENVIYAKFNSKVSSKTIKGWFDGQEFKSSTVGGKKLYRSRRSAFCILDDRTAIFGKSDILKDVLERKGMPTVARGMKNALNDADMSQSICMAMTLKAEGMTNKNMDVPGVRGADKIMAKADSVILQVDLGSDLEFDMSVVCDDSGDAKKLKSKVDDAMTQAQGFVQMVLGSAGKDVFENIKVSTSGSKMSITGQFDTELLEKVAKSAKKAGPPKLPFGA